jgi:hypothetical protein
MNLVESIKKLRTKASVASYERVSWPAGSHFIGKPITLQTVSELSRFVDKKLIEYAREKSILHGSLKPVLDSSETELNDIAPTGYVPTRDCLAVSRNHSVFRIPPDDAPQTQGKVALISSYDLIYDTMTVNATVVVVPSSEVRQYPDWLELGDCLPIQDKIKQTIKENLTIIVRNRGDSVPELPSGPECTALLSLRERITESEFRKYLKYGFIVVRGKDNKMYQIFRNKSHIKVYKNGKLVEEICVRIKDPKIPKTDNVIAFKTILETSEDQLRTMANVYKMV